MSDEFDRLVVSVRADTAGFARDVQQMRDSLEGPLGQGADKAGRLIEASLLRAVTSGKNGFDSLKTGALAALEQIGAGALKLGLNAILGSGGGTGSGSGGGLAAPLTSLIGGLLGLPGRATGGPVSPGSAYLVGERGPELFVPTSSGSIATGGMGGAGRDVRVAITVNAATDAPAALRQSSRQVARAVKAALADQD